MRLQRTKI